MTLFNQVRTFRVMGPKGCLNFVETATAERPTDDIDTQVEKRRLEAEQKRAQWMATYFVGTTVTVVPCNSLGDPVH